MFHPEGPTLRELVQQGLSSTRGGYDLLAPRFDHTPFRTPVDLLARVAPHVGRPARALDVCCGTGAGLILLRPLCREEVVGIDFSAGMLAEAGRRVAGAPGTARVHLEQGDALAMDYDREFDVATCFGAFGHFVGPEQVALLVRIRRALRPGGRFVFLTSGVPSPLSARAAAYRAFNAVMAVRNRLVQPPFVMVYLNFLLPHILPALDAAGLAVAVHPTTWRGHPMQVVVATRR